jgi:zonular occludens toxin Zot
MAVYIVTGKLGNGKTLVSVGRIRDKLKSGCRVATNLDLRLDRLIGVQDKSARLIRIPDKPSADDLYALGKGNETYDEEKNGLLVLDECGTWFNSRNWQDKSRKAVNDWFLHSRKLGWDVMLIVQDVDIIDSQARMAIAEHTCFCRRLDRLHIPFFGTLLKIFTLGEPVRLPRIHIGKVVYGISDQDPLTDRWIYRGTDLFSCYDTKQSFLESYPHGVHSVLPGWHIKGRYAIKLRWAEYMRLTKIMWKRFKSPFALASGLAAGLALGASVAHAAMLLHKEKAEPVAQVKQETSKADDSKPVKTEAQQLVESLAKMRIVGALHSLKNPDNAHYVFSNAKRGGSTSPLTTSRELIESGIGVKYLSDCHALLTYQGQQAEVYCL